MTRRRIVTTLCCALALAPLASIRAQVPLVPSGATWRYLDDGSDQSASYADPLFDDSAWPASAAPLGYGMGDEASVIGFGRDPSAKHITTWFRHAFVVPDPSIYTHAVLRVRRDDGADVSLNGGEVFRSGLPAGVLGPDTLASETVAEATEYNYFEIALDPALLVAGSNLLSAEVHQVSGTSDDLVFDAELLASDREIVTRGPYLQRLSHDAVIVRWRTHVPSFGRVWFGTAQGALGGFVDDGVFDRLHSVTLTGLSPASSYHYAVATPAHVLVGDDGAHTFTTAPLPGTATPFRVWAQGDSGSGDGWAEAVADAYQSWSGGAVPDVWLMLGDNAYDAGTEDQYQAALFDRFPELLRRTALWTTRGNHDSKANVFQDLFDPPTAGEAGGLPSGTEAYYAFDWGNVHFLCLDSQASNPTAGGAMWTWAQADLASTTQDWIIAFWHHPPYSKGTHDSDRESKQVQMRTEILPMLEEYGVDLVLCGHSHGYERSALIDGHYGASSTFVPQFFIDAGDGSPSGDGAYAKAFGSHQGAVYCVAGNAAKVTSNPPSGHPVMVHSAAVRGSLVIDVDGDELAFTFLSDTGTVDDGFTLRKLDPWVDLGNGLAGAAGAPRLTGVGPLVEDKLAGLRVTDALPGASAGLVVGTSVVALPFKGGVLVPRPEAVFPGLAIDAAGELALVGTWPAVIPAGLSLVYQLWVADPSGSHGFSASNGLRGVAQ